MEKVEKKVETVKKVATKNAEPKKVEPKKVEPKKVEKKPRNVILPRQTKFEKFKNKLIGDGDGKKKPLWKVLLSGLGFALWVYVAFYAVQIIASLVLVFAFPNLNIDRPITQLIFAAVVYILALLVIIFVPWFVKKMKTTRDELGLRGLPTWTDIWMAPVAFVVFMIFSTFLTLIMQALLPEIDWEQAQDVGFNQLIGSAEMLQGFLALVVIAPIAEEIMFRGWLYGKLRARMAAIPAILICSLLFGFVHGQWNVAVVTFAMSVAMCLQRELTGTIWSGILLHMLKNGVAFYLLYVAQIA